MAADTAARMAAGIAVVVVADTAAEEAAVVAAAPGAEADTAGIAAVAAQNCCFRPCPSTPSFL